MKIKPHSEMEHRISLPVSLPVPTPTTSYWQSPPDAELSGYLSAEHVSEEEIADVVIIGSGVSGASIAWNLLNTENGKDGEGKERIVMLEARGVCSGATGRNG